MIRILQKFPYIIELSELMLSVCKGTLIAKSATSMCFEVAAHYCLVLLGVLLLVEFVVATATHVLLAVAASNVHAEAWAT